ncbi:DUF2812 domain-containing protein [Anaerotignum sp.]|nr:DUF2812 domain-containing protein [Anaerotignum sp.]MBQ7758244.1 DUF2812 domain-containing protein [Anaerotignum sp.]
MNYKRKFIPVEPYEIGALESWFSDMSAEGLYLYDTNTIFATFAVKEPLRMLYHIEPKNPYHDNCPPNPQLERYEEKGWRFVCTMSQYFYIFSAEEGAENPHTDGEEESKLYEPMNKWNFSKLGKLLNIISVFLLFVMIGIEVSSLSQRNAYRLVTDMEMPFENIPMAVLGFLVPFQRYLGLKRVQDDLREGIPLHQKTDWEDFVLQRNHKLHYAGCFLLALSFVVPLLPWIVSYSDKPIEELKHPLPMVALAEIENDPDFYYLDRYFQRDNRPKYEWWEREANIAYSDITIGAPTQISFNQAGRIDGKTDSRGEPYESVLWVDYKKLSSFVSPKEYMDEYFNLSWRAEEKGWTYTTLNDTPFDYAILAEKGDVTELYLISGQKILELKYYYGDADLTQHYDLYKKVLQQEYHR